MAPHSTLQLCMRAKKPFSSPFFVPDWLIAWLLLSLLQTGDRRRRRRISPKIYFKKLIICLVYCSFFGKLGIGYIYILCMFLGEFRTLKATPDSCRAKIPESAFARLRLRLRRHCLPKGGRGRKKRGRKRRKKPPPSSPPSPRIKSFGKSEGVGRGQYNFWGWVSGSRVSTPNRVCFPGVDGQNKIFSFFSLLGNKRGLLHFLEQ